MWQLISSWVVGADPILLGLTLRWYPWHTLHAE